MATFSNDVAIDYSNKLNLLRSYMGYFTESEITNIFGNKSVAQVLSSYTYSRIKAMLQNALNRSEDDDIDLGRIVLIDKPVLFDKEYRRVRGLVIGKHYVPDNVDTNHNNVIYHMSFDVMILFNTYNDYYTGGGTGYSYEIRRYRSSDLIYTEDSIDTTEDFFNQFNSMLLENPV